MSDLSLGVKDQSFVQSISHPLHQLFPDAILQELLWVHLKNITVSEKLNLWQKQIHEQHYGYACPNKLKADMILNHLDTLKLKVYQ